MTPGGQYCLIISQVHAVVLASFSTMNAESLGRASFLLCAWQLFRDCGFEAHSWFDLMFLLTAGVWWTKWGSIDWHGVQVAHSFASWLGARSLFSACSRPLIENLGEEFLQLLEDFRSVSRLGEAAREQLYWLKNLSLKLLVFDCEDSLLQDVVAKLMHS